ncbi:a2cf800a-bd15-469e-bf54-5c2029873197 [Sclerotinia trifoliorum]|uniref:A2cf800a-bd15-469e-bf54-5c2029873197 n=1 Tax=Sclerotinia trifoliorum TaxID=28548 RepID=A0A8H2ZPY2_9HELO|nr:a2cf800a-bd15-469e-bf54-5c2029873197 [Sclerotinia trifoliorum]
MPGFECTVQKEYPNAEYLERPNHNGANKNYIRAKSSNIHHPLSRNLPGTKHNNTIAHHAYLSLKTETMKFSHIAIGLGAASIVSAQSAACTSAVAAVPACGATCISSAVTKYCPGSVNNYACECASATFSSIKNDATSCVVKACGDATALQVLTAVNNVCAACV